MRKHLRLLLASTLWISLAGCSAAKVDPPLMQQADRHSIDSETADLALVEVPARPHFDAIEQGHTFTATHEAGALILHGENALLLSPYLAALRGNTELAADFLAALREAEAERNQMLESWRGSQEAHNLMARSWADSENARAQEALECSIKVAGYQSVLAIFGLAGFVGGL